VNNNERSHFYPNLSVNATCDLYYVIGIVNQVDSLDIITFAKNAFTWHGGHPIIMAYLDSQ